ncbi:MAG: YoaK family protein [Geminicoccaceae bacterium]
MPHPPAANQGPCGQQVRDRGSGETALLLLLSATAGSTDAIGFLGLNGLFTAHITGNIVILANHLVTQGNGGLAQMISVPVFMAVLGMARLLGLALDRSGNGVATRALLTLQLALLLGFFLLGLPLGPSSDADAPWAVLAGMCGVAAMAVQNALVQTEFPGTPSTAVLTTNITRFTVAAVEAVAGPSVKRGDARDKVRSTSLPIIGFVTGCAAGGCVEWQIGLGALLLPILLALSALLASPDPTT